MSEQSLQQFIDNRMLSFESVAPHLNIIAERGFTEQLLLNNSYLMKVALGNKLSLAHAIDNVAAIGLSLNPAEKLAYLIPRTVNENGKYIAKIFLEPSYIGLCRLATDSGSMEWIQAKDIRENDNFIDHGPGEKPTHDYKPFPAKNRGDVVGFVCIAKTSKGDYLTTTMDVEEVNGIMERSEAVKAHRNNKGGGGPWISDYVEQGKKTVIRRASKTWPKTNERLMNAVHLSNENEGFEPIINNPEIKSFSPEQKSYFDQLIEKGDALGMYVFRESFDVHDASSDSASVWISLMHSFERGSKGKYQSIVNEMSNKGLGIFTDYLSSIESNIGTDDSAITELISELDEESIKLIEHRLPMEYAIDFKRLCDD